MHRIVPWSLRWISPIIDPIRAMTGLRQYIRYFRDWRTYSRLSGAEAIDVVEAFPQLHDRLTSHSLDAHYLYTNGWAMRRIIANRPTEHVDIGSDIAVASLLSAVIPVTFVDYRPLKACLSNLNCIGGDILAMPYPTNSVQSLSCLHVAEHIGLGRYGDPLDPKGTEKAAKELARILAPGGDLFFAVPVGKPKVSFNAHRIHSAESIRNYFANLEIIEFSGVNDDGRFIEHISLSALNSSTYACGMFWFRKPK